MLVSVIIVNYNVKYFLELCLQSVVAGLKNIAHEIIVVDNHSKDDNCDFVRQHFPQVQIIANNSNLGFSKANNQAFEIAKGKYVLFLNPDTVLPEDFFSLSIAFMEKHANIGALGPRIIDGKGSFSPDGKKSFPSFSVAFYKTTGINQLFKNSSYFNKYYAVHVGEFKTAEVDVLSGCCMLTRKEAVIKAGGAFDEDYFMYCEDVDLCYRLQKTGFKNYYFPLTTIIHYKGESTKKGSLSYVKIFNEALITFVKKHYSNQHATVFILLIKIGIAFRSFLGLVKQFFRVLKMPLFDAIVILATLLLVTEFWVEQIKNIAPIPTRSILITYPIYTAIWILSLFINGAYDQPYKPNRVIRGMLTGIVLGLAFFGLLPAEMRHSRATIFLTGISSSIALIALHEWLHRLGIFKFISFDQLPGNAVILAREQRFITTSEILDQIHYAPKIYGRIEPNEVNNTTNAIGNIRDLEPFLVTADVEEIIFCTNELPFKKILDLMQTCGSNYDFKIHVEGSKSFVGSNSSNSAGDLYVLDQRFNLSNPSHLRNKRILDILMCFALLFLFPFIFFKQESIKQFFSNWFQVLIGNKSWVGYGCSINEQSGLPQLKKSIIPCYRIIENFNPNEQMLSKMNELYALYYKTSNDVRFLIENLKFLGRKS